MVTPLLDRLQHSRYFTLAVLVFMAAYLCIPTAKWINSYYYAAIALPALILFVLRPRLIDWRSPLLLLWLVFLAWFIVPGARAEEGQFFKHILYVLLFVLSVACLVDGDFFRRPGFVRLAFWVVCAYAVGSSLVFWLTGHYAVGQRVIHLPGRISNPIYVSIWMVCLGGLAAPTWIRERRWIELLAAVVVTIVGISFALQTRTGLVGIGFLAALGVLFAFPRFPLRTLALVVLVSALIAGVVQVVHTEAWFVAFWGRADSGRIELFHFMIKDWESCGWWLGCGLGYQSHDLLHGTEAIQHPHNIFVSFGIYTGLVSLLIFGVLMLASLGAALRQRDPWGLYLAVALLMLNFDGAKLIGNPDELWPLVLLPAAMIAGAEVQRRRKLALGQAVPV